MPWVRNQVGEKMAKLSKPATAKLILVIGVALLGWSGYTYTKASASESWPSTRGVVITSMVNKTTKTSGTKTKWVYEPVLKYEYTVEGVTYTGDKIRFKVISLTYEKEHKAKRSISAYPVGKTVDVFYNPGIPSDAVLKTGVGSSVFIGFFVGIALLVVGMAIVKSS